METRQVAVTIKSSKMVCLITSFHIYTVINIPNTTCHRNANEEKYTQKIRNKKGNHMNKTPIQFIEPNTKIDHPKNEGR